MYASSSAAIAKFSSSPRDICSCDCYILDNIWLIVKDWSAMALTSTWSYWIIEISLSSSVGMKFPLCFSVGLKLGICSGTTCFSFRMGEALVNSKLNMRSLVAFVETELRFYYLIFSAWAAFLYCILDLMLSYCILISFLTYCIES